jgi:hypothetical protein
VALQEKTVCYCSSFDLDADDWMASYRNLRNFTIDLHSNLGKIFFLLKASQNPSGVSLLVNIAY